jgi:hypothetical protein
MIIIHANDADLDWQGHLDIRTNNIVLHTVCYGTYFCAQFTKFLGRLLSRV